MQTHIIADPEIGKPTESHTKTATTSTRLLPKLRISFLSCLFMFLVMPATSSAAGLAYLEANAPSFISQTKDTYGDMVNIAALLHDFDKNLILAVIVVESEGNEVATSHRGAQGLMQLMPATAKSLGVTNSKEPFQNILAGTKYLKQLETIYGFSNPQEALVAYNMGPSRAKRWLSQYGAENYLYVQKVMYVYGLLNAGDEQRSRLADASEGTYQNPVTSTHLFTKPRMLSMAAFPVTLPSTRKTETESE